MHRLPVPGGLLSPADSTRGGGDEARPALRPLGWGRLGARAVRAQQAASSGRQAPSRLLSQRPGHGREPGRCVLAVLTSQTRLKESKLKGRWK